MNRLIPATLALSLVVCCSCQSPADPAQPAKPAASGEWSVAKTLPIGGEGRWDYVTIDPASQLLYVPRQTHTQVISTKSGQVVADIPDTGGVHGVALAPALNRGFTSNGKANTVTVFDLKTNKVIGTIPVGDGPDCILFDSASGKLFTFNGRGQDITVIDAAADPADAVVARIALDHKPEFAVSNGQGRIYVNLEDFNAVVEIDTKILKRSHVWKIDGGEEPSGLAIDPANHRLFIGCDNQVMAVIDTQTGLTIGKVAIGKGVDACAFDPVTNEAFASCGDGTLTVAKETAPGKFEVIQTVQTHPGARTMALDSATRTIYLPTAEMTPPAAGEERPAPKAGTFMIVKVVGK